MLLSWLVFVFVCVCTAQVFAGLDYFAEPADIWSCGIVLVALLAGGMYVCAQIAYIFYYREGVVTSER